MMLLLMIQGKSVGFRAKNVQVSSHLPLVSTDDGINHGEHILRSIYALRDHIVAIETQDKSTMITRWI